MAKKTWAYAKNERDEFILDQYDSSRLRTFYVWEVLKLKNSLPEDYKKLNFYSTQANPSNRSRMTPVKNGFFKYIENITGGSNSEGDNETISHSMAILVLSELKNIKFIINDKTYVFNFSKFIIEPRLQFENSNVYFPDLIGYFSSECDLAEKWNGKVAIEIAVKHKCTPQKIRDFLEYGIPIIEINISDKMCFSKEFNRHVYDANDVEKYYNFFKKMLSNQVYGSIRSNPTSSSYYEKQLVKKNKIIDENQQGFDELKELSKLKLIEAINQYKNVKNSLNNIKLINQQLEQALSKSQQNENSLKNKMEEINSMSFWQKIKQIFN
ncbi:hypothetical protein RHO12_06105 [Orbus sturtevantii]|uniref:hypothetical protein n=1 Tax=Orbus sturtevantii TaxID=3074109 RepID=UPI00370DC08D